MERSSTFRGDRCHASDPPSFSSTLLDAIYRSLDDSNHQHHDPLSRPRSQSQSRQDDEEVAFFRELMLKKQNSTNNGENPTANLMNMKSSAASLHRKNRAADADGRRSRDRIVDRWMDKRAMIDDDFVIRRRSLTPETSTEFAALRSLVSESNRRRSLGSMRLTSSSTSSSDSSSGGGFSPSDNEFLYGANENKSLKSIRTSVSARHAETFRPRTQFTDEFLYRKNGHSDQRPKSRDSPGKTAKSRAMKFYGDLKRMKQPISPAGKLANFLNSLFSPSGRSKKQRISSSRSSASAAGDPCNAGRWEMESKSNFSTSATPTCSTASSYSHSCLSKTPSSVGRYDVGFAGVKRSVRFCPVSVIVDEDLRPCGHKSLCGNGNFKTTTRTSCKAAIGGSEGESVSTVVDEELKLRVLEKNRRVEEMARDLLRNYHKRRELEARKDQIDGEDEEMEALRDQNEDDDVESCCSSDLFELEIGVDRYCEELPVYETTQLDTNRAIASGLIV